MKLINHVLVPPHTESASTRSLRVNSLVCWLHTWPLPWAVYLLKPSGKPMSQEATEEAEKMLVRAGELSVPGMAPLCQAHHPGPSLAPLY